MVSSSLLAGEKEGMVMGDCRRSLFPDPPATGMLVMMTITGWGWRWAATLAVVVGITLTVTPARALLLDTLGSLQTFIKPSDPSLLPSPEGSVTASSILVAATDTVLFVDFAAHQQTGTLSIEHGTSETQVSATMYGDIADDELTVFGNNVRVVNTAQSTADYVVTLPTSILLIEVRIGRAVIARYSTDGTEEPWPLQLAP